MHTEYITIDPKNFSDAKLLPFAKALAAGELVVFPTETVYGLGVNALRDELVPKVYATKGRPSDNPLIVHVHSLQQVPDLVRNISDLAGFLMQKFMPGPLTIVLPKSERIGSNVSAGLDTVGIRIPVHPVANALLRLAAVPVAAPSANLSGKPSPTNGRDCLEDLDGLVPYIIDAGASNYGLESTVLSMINDEPKILRPGAITAGMISAACAEFYAQTASLNNTRKATPDLTGEAPAGENLAVYPTAKQTEIIYQTTLKPEQDGSLPTPMAPGMKYRHYAPKAAVVIIEGEDLATLQENFLQYLATIASAANAKKVSGIAVPPDADQEDALTAKTINSGSPKVKFNKIGFFVAEELLQIIPSAINNDLSHLAKITYGSYDDYRSAGHALFAALRALDRQGVDLIVTNALPDREQGKAYMNRLRKAASKL